MAKMTQEFQEAFNGYLKAAQSVYDDYIYRNGFDSQRVEFTYKVGKKYVKVISAGSVHSFVSMETGQIFKPASWAAPAKHARGNINSEDSGKSCVGPHGPHYLR